VSVLNWFKRRSGDGNAVRGWRADWTHAIETMDGAAPERLRRALQEIPGSSDDLDVEHEMLDALEQVLDLHHALVASELPVVETGHRVVGSDQCHFSAPVSLPDDPAQPSGRLLLTSTRAIFVAGRLVTLPWHAARQATRADRDVLLIRVATGDGVRFRCNNYADALRATEIARYLIARLRKGKASEDRPEEL
jgi:hypothetical protein